ncbi:hypothetical protein BS47DRAFT_1364601 [Hydnum rufescens UP504]|uniref:Uncharacterized protein n=1 Tax=Hydnum rufescens UP504 TaxID=1448309 RepID=A0A9P6AS13_9AGAM|nr:hypothetical protein BS47DRAFT_1364601 [Hydnum rufescens UP504]
MASYLIISHDPLSEMANQAINAECRLTRQSHSPWLIIFFTERCNTDGPLLFLAYINIFLRMISLQVSTECGITGFSGIPPHPILEGVTLRLSAVNCSGMLALNPLLSVLEKPKGFFDWLLECHEDGGVWPLVLVFQKSPGLLLKQGQS